MSIGEVPQAWQRQSDTTSAKFPDYAHPPLVFVVLEVRFAHHSLTDDQRARFEQLLGPAWQPSGPTPREGWQTNIGDQGLRFGGHFLRYWWNGLTGDMYPHYPLVRDGFVEIWNAWCQAVEMPEPLGWKIQYVNRIAQQTVWQSLADCSFCRWLSPLPAIEGLPQPENVSFDWRFPLDRYGAKLQVLLGSNGPVSQGNDEPPALWLDLRCQGRLSDPDNTFLAGFDYGREVIVRTFRQLMQPAANEFWGLKS
jgi:hypothetical protein